MNDLREPTREMAAAFQKAHDAHAAARIPKIYAKGQREEANVIVGLRAALAAMPALSAAQPEGGDAVAWATHHEPPMLFPTRAEAAAYCCDDEQPIGLYARPAPAQQAATDAVLHYMRATKAVQDNPKMLLSDPASHDACAAGMAGLESAREAMFAAALTSTAAKAAEGAK